MENSCYKKIRCLGGPESSKSAILDGKQLFVKKVFGRPRELKIGCLRWKTAVCKKIRCLGGPESSKSAILDGKQLPILSQVFRRARD